MLRKLVFMLLIVSLALTASSAFGVVWHYWGNVSPDTTPMFGVEAWGPYTEYGTLANMGVVDNDPAASDGKAWRITDNSTTASDVWRTPGIIDLGSVTGATIVARIKTTSDTDGGGNIGIAQQNYGSFVHWGGANGLLKETVRDQSVTVPSDGNYHVIRLTAKGEDSTPVPITTDFTMTDGNLYNRGDWTGPDTSDIKILNNQVVITGTTVAGGLAARHTYTVNPNANGIITVTCKVTPPAAPALAAWVFKVTAFDTAGNIYGVWNAFASQARGRIGNIATAWGLFNLGVENTLKMEIDVINNICKYYVNGINVGGAANGGQPYPGAPAGVPTIPVGAPMPCTWQCGNQLGAVTLESFPSADIPKDSVTIDDLVVDGTALPHAARVIKVYVDDVLKQTIIEPDATTANIAGGKMDNFVFGSGAGMQDVSFDWITMTNEGAFAPGEEVATLGYVLNDENHAVTSFADIANAKVGTAVDLKGAIVTASFFGIMPDLNVGNVGFGIEDPDRFAGVRVVSDFPAYANTILDIEGTVGVVDGERVIIATKVTDTFNVPEAAIKPLAISNKSVAGGAQGAQAALVDYADRTTGAPSYEETFTYVNGALAGNGGWTGDATSRLAVNNGALTILSHGWDFPTDVMKITKAVNAGDCGTGEITLKMKIQKGVGGDSFWDLRVKDSTGLDICYLFGAGEYITGRGQGTDITTGAKTLNSGWNDLEIKITGGNAVQFFLNGTAMNASTFSAAFDGSIGSIEINRLANTVAVQSNVSIDDLQIFPSAQTGAGLNSVGILSTIYGRVTHVKGTGAWDDYFYVDDGTGYFDGTSDGSAKNIGIRCRPASSFMQLNGMPVTGEFVSVTGVMGAKAAGGNIIRNFWTSTFEVKPE